MSLTQLSRATLQVNKISEENGFVEIKMREVDIVNETITIVHVIDIGEVRNILDTIEKNIETLDINNRNVLENEIQLLRSKIKTLIPKDNRKRRGLFNFGGKVYKWVFGTMDDEDRQEIYDHLSVTDQNSHKSIETLNKQIIVNDSFNKSLGYLKSALEDDRKKILNYFGKIKMDNNEYISRFFFLDQLAKLKNLEHKLDQIQDNIVSAKNNIIHPSIFSPQEIDDFEIDFYKLKMLKVGIMTFSDQAIIVAIQIPKNFIRTELKLITRIPNKNSLEIDSEDQYIVDINGQNLIFKDNVAIRTLKKSKNCIFFNNCKFIYNNETEIINIDEETLIVKNSNYVKVDQDCDDRQFNLTGNFLIIFNNCNISMLNESFSNKKVLYKEKYFYPNSNKLDVTNIDFKFKNIATEHFENIKEIKELKFHRNVSYGISLTLVFVIFALFLILYCLTKKNNVKVNIRQERVQENSQIREREVLNPSPQISEIIAKYSR